PHTSTLSLHDALPISAYLEEAVLATLRRQDINSVRVHGKDVLPLAGEYTGEVVLTGISKFLGRDGAVAPIKSLKEKAAQLLGARSEEHTSELQSQSNL